MHLYFPTDFQTFDIILHRALMGPGCLMKRSLTFIRSLVPTALATYNHRDGKRRQHRVLFVTKITD